jgi:hypothetical protein
MFKKQIQKNEMCPPKFFNWCSFLLFFFATMEKISVFFSKGHRHFYVFLHGVRVFELDRVRLRERDDGRHFRRRKEGQDRSLAQHHSLRKLQHAVCIRPTKTCATATTKCTKQSGNTFFCRKIGVFLSKVFHVHLTFTYPICWSDAQ